MGLKTAGVGHFTIPTAPAAGTSCTSGAANTFTTTYVQLIASTSAALFITGIYVEEAAVSAATYIVVQLATGGAGSETIVGQYLVAPQTGSTVTRTYRPIYPPIPVANATRIACKTADSVGAAAKLIMLECINQSNVVDDGVAVATVTTVTNQLTAAQIATGVWQDATAGDFTVASSIGKSLYTTGNAPGAANGLQIAGANAATTYATLTSTGAFTVNGVANVSQTGDSFAVVKSGGTGDNAAIKAKTDNLPAAPASTTNITAGTITTVTNLTNLPSIPANWLTAAGINAGALNGKGDWLLSSGYTAPLTAATTRAAVGLASANLDTQLAALDADVLTRLASASYTAPDNASVTAIKAKTDSLVFTVAGFIDANILKVNGTTVTGNGAAGSRWNP